MNTLTLMCGIPRCGKSSWIQNNKKDAIIVCPDSIRKEIFGHQFHQPANKFVFAITEAMVLLLLKQNKNVIVDATHMTRSLRMGWYPIIKDLNVKARIVWVYADRDPIKNFKICLERNKLSNPDEIVPEDVLERMSIQFEPPDPSNEFFEIIEYRNNTKVS